jgi:hypothetical protein
MTTQPIASSRPTASGHRRTRTTVAISVAALIAAGGYLATTTNGPDAAPPAQAGTGVNPNPQVLRELHESIAGQYGSRSTVGGVNPSAQTRRELRESIAGQYGPAR